MNLLPEKYKDDYHAYAQDLVDFLTDFFVIVNYFNPESMETGKITKDYFNHFIIKNHYEKIPKDWKIACEKMEMVDLLNMVTKGEVHDHFPDSLTSFINRAQNLKLQQKCLEVKNDESDFLFTYGMNMKKQHEVTRLAQVIADVAENLDTKSIVDIGSGKGYLTSVLDLKFGLNVIGVDRQEPLTKKTDVRRDQIEKKVKSMGKDHEKGSTDSVAAHLALDINLDEFLDLIQPFVKEKNILLVGLHTCGDLAATTIKLFLQSNARGLINVGCCFDKLTEEWNTPKYYGFPMSDLMKMNKIMLGNAKFLAVLSHDSWTVENVEQSEYHFMRNSFRVVLEALLHSNLHTPLPKKCFIIRVKPQYSNDFVSYCKRAIARVLETERDIFTFEFIKLFESKDFDDYLLEYFSKYEKEAIRKQVEVYWSLRAVFGPILESLILIDRVIYLQDQGIKADLVRLFKYEISPRGIALIARK